MNTSFTITRRGCIYFFYGPMFGEKGLEAIRRALHAAHGRKPFLEPIWLKPEVDTHADCVKSRIGVSYPAQSLSRDVRLACAQLLNIFETPSVVCIDEAQFLCSPEEGELVDEALVNLMLDTLIHGMLSGSQIFIAGLDSNYRRETFPLSRALLLDPRIKRQQMFAICAVCTEEATLTQRLLNGKPAPRNMPTIVVKDEIDSLVSYEPRCAMCHEIPD